MFLKAGIIYLMLFLFVKHKRVAIKTAFILSQIGEFSFVIFALLEKYSLVDNVLLQKLVVVVVISMILTPFVIKNIYKIADIFDNDIQNFEEYEIKPAEVKGHIILIGYDKIGQRIARKLTKVKIPYIAIDKQIELVKQGLKNGDNVIFGNAANRRILESMNVKEAAAVIITTLNEEHTKLIANNLLEINPNLNIILLTENEALKDSFNHKNVYVLDKSKELAQTLIKLALKCELKGTV